MVYYFLKGKIMQARAEQRSRQMIKSKKSASELIKARSDLRCSLIFTKKHSTRCLSL